MKWSKSKSAILMLNEECAIGCIYYANLGGKINNIRLWSRRRSNSESVFFLLDAVEKVIKMHSRRKFMLKSNKGEIVIEKRGWVSLWYACVKSFAVAVRKRGKGKILDNRKIKMILRRVNPKTQTGN